MYVEAKPVGQLPDDSPTAALIRQIHDERDRLSKNIQCLWGRLTPVRIEVPASGQTVASIGERGEQASPLEVNLRSILDAIHCEADSVADMIAGLRV